MPSDIASFAAALSNRSAFALTRDRLDEMVQVVQACRGDSTESFIPSLERQSQEPKPGAVEPELINAFLDSLGNELRDIRADIRVRASRAFAAALTLGITGAVALFTGIGFLLSGKTAAGTVSSICAAVTGLFSGIFVKLYFTENGDLRSILGDLSLIERIRVRVQVAAQIKDAKKRDDTLSAIVSELGKAAPKPSRKAPAK